MDIRIFNINQALNGASVGFAEGNNVIQYIIDFKRSNEKTANKEFVGVGQDDNKQYFFNKEGYCSDGLTIHRLWKIEEEIKFTEGTASTRGYDEGDTVNIDTIQPRDQFALAAMQSIITKIEDNILGIDNYKISKICDLSYKIAQKMMDTSAKYRDLTEGETESPYIDIDKTAITENTDKILYNIQAVLKGG